MNDLLQSELDALSQYYSGAFSSRAVEAYRAIKELQRLRRKIVAWYDERHETDALAQEAMRIINDNDHP